MLRPKGVLAKFRLRKREWTVERVPDLRWPEEPYESLAGHFDPVNDKIRLCTDISAADEIEVYIHELVHLYCNIHETFPDTPAGEIREEKFCNDMAEVLAAGLSPWLKKLTKKRNP